MKDEQNKPRKIVVPRAYKAGEYPRNSHKPEGLEDAINDYIAGWVALGLHPPVVVDYDNSDDGTIDPWKVVGFLTGIGPENATIDICTNTPQLFADNTRLVFTTDGKAKNGTYYVSRVVRLALVSAENI